MNTNYLSRMLLILVMVALSPAYTWATEKNAVLQVPPHVEIDGRTVLLGDIAEIDRTAAMSDSSLMRLQSLSLGLAPEPGAQIVLKGEDIIAAMTAAGFSLDDLGYSIPKEVVIRRSGRLLSKQELMDVAERAIRANAESKDQATEIRVRDVLVNQQQTIPVGESEIEISQVGMSRQGRVPLSYLIKSAGNVERIFPATALVDEWRLIPIASRDLERGKIIESADLTLVKVNMAEQNGYISEQESDILGKKLKNRVLAGNSFKASNLENPPLINRGKRVLLSYNSGALSATATGIAIEDGFRGMVVAVRNESSKRVVRGIAANESLVQITDQIE